MSQGQWVGYIKGGESTPYYGNLDTMIYWGRRQKIKENPSHRICNEEFFFKQGITFTKASSKKFAARHLPKGFIWDTAGPCIFPKQNNNKNFYQLGFLNTRLVNSFLDIINPTLSFQIGDVSKIPYLSPTPEIERRISALAQQCVNIKKDVLQFVINDREFKQTAIQWGLNMNFKNLPIKQYLRQLVCTNQH